jgi:hypothetical protein
MLVIARRNCDYFAKLLSLKWVICFNHVIMFLSYTGKSVKLTPLSDLMSSRAVAVAIGGVAVAQVGLSLAGLPGWTCPFHAALGIPCPGCGLTQATDLLLRGQVSASLQTHAFAPILLVCVVLLVLSAMLPAAQRIRFVGAVQAFEQRTRISAVLLFGLLVYWGFRLFGMV